MSRAVPLQPAPGAPAASASPPPAVLLVDDSADHRRALAACLEGLEARLVLAASGEEALRHVLREDFAAVLLDVHLGGGMDGLETARHLRAHARSRTTPLLFLTGTAVDPAAALDGYGAGAVDYLLKPFPVEVLRSKVAVFLELHRAHARVREQGALLQGRAERLAETASEQLARSEAQLRQVTDALPALVSLVGPDERYERVNQAYTEWFGLPREEVEGRTLEEVMGEAAYRALRPHVLRALAGEAFTIELEAPYRLGGTRHIQASFQPQHDATGAVTGYVSLVQDVSREVRARHRAARLQAATTALLRAVAPGDVAAAVLAEATGELGAQVGLFYRCEGEGEGRALRLLAAAGRASPALEDHRTIPLATPLPATDVVKSGEPMWLSSRDAMLARYPHLARVQMLGHNQAWVVLPLPGPTGAASGALALSFREERPRDADELGFLGALAQQAALALERSRLYEEAQGAAQAREDFLSVAAHELRTPLTSLKLQLRMLERRLSPESRATTGRHVQSALRQGERLAQLVESLLDVSRLAQGRLEVEVGPVDVGALVRDVLGRMEPVFGEAGCRVELHLPGPAAVARADGARLDQVLVNLLSNAAKYGAGKPVRVRVWRGEGHGGASGGGAGGGAGRLLVEVRDGGIGIAREALPRLFRRFERAVSDRHYGGLGLGLFISRQLLEAMGGSVSVESRPGEGAAFTVSLEALPSDAL